MQSGKNAVVVVGAWRVSTTLAHEDTKSKTGIPKPIGLRGGECVA